MNNNSYYNEVDSDQDLNIRDADSKSRVKLGQAKRDKRNKAKELKAAFKQRLKSLDNTKDRRELKEQFKSSLKDIDTGLESNRGGAGSTVQDDGVDNVDSSNDGSVGGGGVEFNGSVLICINGSPYYIDIPYDSETGPYAPGSGANFPITVT